MYWTRLSAVLVCVIVVVRTQVIPGKSRTSDGDYNTVNTDGSFDFGYANKDRGSSYHLARGNANGVVGGRFGARDPKTDTIKETVYTAGPRGFRAKGPNVHRKMDLDQRPRGPIGNKDDPYFDPNEDPSYAFKADTATYSKNEVADSRGDVKGHYSYIDDIGERHDVSYIAGRDTGFHVSSAHPDNPNLIGAPFHRAPLVRGESRPRGRTAIQRGLDGSYRFISAGPDQRRTESSDSNGNVRGSYTFLDDKGVQRTVHYIAGPGIGYRIVKNGKDPYIPAYFPTIPSVYDPDFVSADAPSFAPDDVSSNSDDIFKGPDATAASGHVKPPPFPSSDKDRPHKKPGSTIAPSRPDSSETSGGFGSDGFDGSGSKKPVYGSGSSSGRPGYGSGTGSDRPSYGSGSSSSRPGYGGGSSGSRPGGSRPSYGSGSSGSSFGSGLGGDGSSYGSGPGVDVSYIDEDYGKPTKGPGKPGRPTNKPYRPSKLPFRPTKKPYVPLKPSQSLPSNGGSYGSTNSFNSDDNNSPEFSTINFESNKNNDNKGPEYAVGFNIQHDKPGSTIIRNIGQDYLGVAPGVSVRAHVQSIDLYPFNSKPISPSEALEKDKT